MLIAPKLGVDFNGIAIIILFVVSWRGWGGISNNYDSLLVTFCNSLLKIFLAGKILETGVMNLHDKRGNYRAEMDKLKMIVRKHR